MTSVLNDANAVNRNAVHGFEQVQFVAMNLCVKNGERQKCIDNSLLSIDRLASNMVNFICSILKKMNFIRK